MTAPQAPPTQNQPPAPPWGPAALIILLLAGLTGFIASQQSSTPPKSTTTTTATTTSSSSTSSTPRVTTTVLPTTAPTGADFTVHPSGGDDTAALVAAITAHPSVVVDQPLRVDHIVELDNLTQRTITFEGTGALMRSVIVNPDNPANTVTFPVLRFVADHDVTLNNVVVAGPGGVCDVPRVPPSPGLSATIGVAYYASREEQAAIDLEGVDHFTVNGGNLHDVPGDGVEIFYNHLTNPSTPSSFVTLNNLTTRCTGRDSISNISSADVVVNGGSFDRAGRQILNVEPFNALTVDRYTVTGSTIGFSNASWLYVGGPYFHCGTTRVAGVRVTNVTITNKNAIKSVIGCADVVAP